VQDLGERLKAARNERGFTLTRLGLEVDLSASYLSQIERGMAMPSLPKLAAIARALDVDVAYFFEEDASLPCPVRAHQGRKLADTHGMCIEILSADLPHRRILPYRLICQPGASRQQSPIHPGEECCFVLRGQLTVIVGEETFVLQAGDSIHYQKLQPHSWRNEGDEECVAVWAVSPPINEDELQG
jgi:transcriptional regulator with XRE-family HTH domain